MKTTLTILMLVLLSAGTTSCHQLKANEEPVQPPAPDPIEVLEGQVETERQHRLEAEQQAADEAELRQRWELAAVGLAVLTIVGFFAGTTIGSRGKRHATVATTA